MSASPRIAFVSGQSRWWRKQRLAAKYLKMRLEGIVYPDVYCLAFMLADKFDFLLEDEKVPAGKYDLILAELGGSENQLRYLESLVMAADPAVAVIPGPPAILSRDLTDEKLRRVKRILGAARHVWAYAEELKNFCDGLIGREKAVVIPWPYDLAATRTLALGAGADTSNGAESTADAKSAEASQFAREHEARRHKILVQIPMCFHDIVFNHPFVLKGVLLDVWQELPSELRERITFHTFIYNATDRELYQSTGFDKDLPFVLEGKRGYRSFVRLIGECDGVINLTVGNILGRITFLAAALGKPGIFSNNIALNSRLYPNSCVSTFDAVRLRDLLSALLMGLVDSAAPGGTNRRLLPCAQAAAEIGDFAANQRRLREIAQFS